MSVIRSRELRVVEQSQLLLTISHSKVIRESFVRERDDGKRYVGEDGEELASSCEHVYDLICD